jgi:hypothetical protein
MAALMAGGGQARAADHLDAPGAKAAPEADITDVYTWMSADKAKTYLIMNVTPMATAASKFSAAVQYVFHINSSDAYGETDASKIKHVNLICTFDSGQKISCWLGPASASGVSSTTDYVNGDASATTGLASTNKKFTVFAGLRDDPFFFNLDGFHATEALVEAAAAKPGFSSIVDGSGCPHLDAATAGALASQLAHDPTGGPPKDFFSKLNVLSIVVSIDTTEVNSGGKIVGVWASTHRKP